MFFPSQKAKFLEVPALLAQVANGMNERQALFAQAARLRGSTLAAGSFFFSRLRMVHPEL